MDTRNNFDEVIDKFLIYLRSVGASYNEKELSEKTIQDISQVRTLYTFLVQHQINFGEQLQELSKLCNWDLKQLLNDILHYPEVTPRVKRPDGRLYYEFSEPTPPKPIDKDIKEELIRLANKITSTEKRNELVCKINEEESLLYVTTELSLSRDLSDEEKERAKKLFEYFY